MPDLPLPTSDPGPLAAAVEADLSSQGSSPAPDVENVSDGPSDAEIAAQLGGKPAPTTEPEPPGPSKAEEFIAKVVREKKRLRAEQQRLRQESERNQEAIRAAQEYQELQKLSSEDPLAAYQRLNIDPEALIKRMVEEGEKHRPLSVEERLERIEQQRKADALEAERRLQEQEESRHKQELDQHVSQYKTVVQQLALDNVDRYELINTYGQANRVWNAALTFYKENGRIPDPEVVMDVVENDLRNDLKKLLSTSFFKSLVQEYQGKSKPAATVSKTPRPASLTNSIARSTASPLKDEEDETDEEREKAAIALLTGSR